MGYGMDGLSSNPMQEIFLQNLETSSGTHPASRATGTSIVSRVKNSRSWC